VLREGRNVLALEIDLPANADPAKALLDFCLLEVREPDVPLSRLGVDAEYEEKTVERRAMVCDMCSSHPSQTPACVSACPHDAAWRGDPTAANSPLRFT
jgi:Fe-S-cluster-containing hydrogenase component 2